MLSVIPQNIPNNLRETPNWVCWKYEQVPGRAEPAKVPREPICCSRASTTNPRDWYSFDLCMQRLHKGGMDGIGYVFSPKDPYIGIDLDDVRSPATGEVLPWASAWIAAGASYCEISPSGAGCKIFGRGRLPGGSGVQKKLVDGSAFEMYSEARYFCVTGHPLAGVPGVLGDVQPLVDQLLSRYFANEPPQPAAKPACKSDYLDSLQRVESYLQKLGVRYRRKETSHATKFQIQCLFNPSHSIPDAVFWVMSSGALAYKCSHSSCAGKDLRQVVASFGKLGN